MVLKELSKQNLSNAQEGWNEAIAEAQSQIGESLRRVGRLKGAIRTFGELKAEGAPFPVPIEDSESVN